MVRRTSAEEARDCGCCVLTRSEDKRIAYILFTLRHTIITTNDL